MLACALLPRTGLSAGGFQTGTFHSPKGFGICIDHRSSPDIINSYMLYADLYGVLDGSVCSPGVKLVYLHQNRFLTFKTGEAESGLFIAPGFSTGYVHDSGSERAGLITAADLSISVRFCFARNVDIEAGFLTELGFISRKGEYGPSIKVYQTGLHTGYIPHLKLMYRFK